MSKNTNIVSLLQKRELGKGRNILRTQETPMGEYPAIRIRNVALCCPLCQDVFGAWVIRLHDMVDYLPHLDHYYMDFRCSECLMTGVPLSGYSP